MVEGDEKERLKQAGLTQERASRGGACCRPDHGGCATRTPEFTWLSLLRALSSHRPRRLFLLGSTSDSTKGNNKANGP